MICNVTGRVYLQDGRLAKNYKIYIAPAGPVIPGLTGSLLPNIITVKTDNKGEVDFTIADGAYRGFYTIGNKNYSFAFNVPDQPRADFADCLIFDDYNNSWPYWLEQAFEARDEANQAAQDAADLVSGALNNYDSRDDFVSAVAGGKVWEVGAVVNAGGYAYRYVGGTTPVPSLNGWIPEGDATQYHFGAVGDYDTDDTDAIKAWFNYYALSKKPLWSEAGVFGVEDYITLPEGIKTSGVGGPRITTFPLYGVDKNKLRPGHKGTISGSVIVFKGTPTSAPFVTERTDKYASITPCLLYPHYATCDVSGFDVVQDMDVLDAAGELTTAVTDNAARGYTAGVLQLGYASRFNIGVFGYFSVGGFISYSKQVSGNPNPDYVTIFDCDIASGLHVLGGNDPSVPAISNTGLTSMGSRLYGSDHHTRADCDPTIPTLYVDGITGGSGRGIRGVSVVGGGLRTYANDAVVFDHCDDVTLSGVTTEFSKVAGVPGLDQDGVIKGTANTYNVTLVGVAATGNLGLSALANAISGRYSFVQAGEFDSLVAGGGGGGVGNNASVRLYGGSGDSVIQLTSDLSSSNNGWTIRRDVSEADRFDIRWNGGTLFTLSTAGAARLNGDLIAGSVAARTRLREQTTFIPIADGAVTVPAGFSFIKVDTEGSTETDDLTQVDGMVSGDLVFLKANNAARTIVIKHSTAGGNIRTNGRVDITLDNSLDVAMLFHNGSHVVASLFADAGT